MKSFDSEMLKSRWFTKEGQKSREALTQAIFKRSTFTAEMWRQIFKDLPFSHEAHKSNDLRGIDLSGMMMDKAQLYDLDLQWAFFDNCTFISAELDFSRLNYASLKNSRFDNCQMFAISADHACFDDSHFINSDLTSSSYQYAGFKNARFENCDMVSIRAKGANFEGVTFRNTRFGTHLQNTLFDHADLEGQNLSLCYFNDASFRSANLKNANASKANFENANFENADLRNTDFTGSNLKGASFTGANTEGTIFTDVTR